MEPLAQWSPFFFLIFLDSFKLSQREQDADSFFPHGHWASEWSHGALTHRKPQISGALERRALRIRLEFQNVMDMT